MIRDGHLTAFYLFEVADAVALDRVAGILGQAASPAKLSPKPATPAYVQYQQPPLTFDGAVFDVSEIRGLRVRVRVYDYGVISIALSRPFAGTWSDLIASGLQIVDNAALEAGRDVGLPASRGPAPYGARQAAAGIPGRGLRRLHRLRARAAAHRRRPDRATRRRHRAAPPRRESAAQRAGDRRRPEEPPLVSRRRCRDSGVERRRSSTTPRPAPPPPRTSSSSRTRSCCSSATTTSCSTRSSGSCTTICRRNGGRTCSRPGATRALRVRCTRCSSTSASCSTGPRTR